MIPLLISDRTDNLYDNLLNHPVGRARLTVEHIKGRDLPAGVNAVYRGSENAFRLILPPENILHLRRKITVKGKKLRGHHMRLNSLTEVFRISLSRFTRNMDEPEKDIWYLDKGEPASLPASRVYRLKFVVSLTRGNEKPELFFYRVHMRQDGIMRIEALS